MTLIQGASTISCKQNYSRLIKEGYPSKQAFAIMAKTCRNNIIKVDIKRQIQIRNRDFFGDYSVR